MHQLSMVSITTSCVKNISICRGWLNVHINTGHHVTAPSLYVASDCWLKAKLGADKIIWNYSRTCKSVNVLTKLHLGKTIQRPLTVQHCTNWTYDKLLLKLIHIFIEDGISFHCQQQIAWQLRKISWAFTN